MSTAIRLKRIGRKKQPFYRVIVIDSRSRRDGRAIEDLGWYNPMTDESEINAESYAKWIGYGAQPSDRVASVMKKKAAA